MLSLYQNLPGNDTPPRAIDPKEQIYFDDFLNISVENTTKYLAQDLTVLGVIRQLWGPPRLL